MLADSPTVCLLNYLIEISFLPELLFCGHVAWINAYTVALILPVSRRLDVFIEPHHGRI